MSWSCAVNGAAYGNILPDGIGQVREWAPLLGKACADSESNTCFSDAIEWSSIALEYGNRSVSSAEECAGLCAQADDCEVWTYWPYGGPSQALPPKCDLCPASLGGSFDRDQVYCENDTCNVCSGPQDDAAAQGIAADAGYSCEDARTWFAYTIGCCIYDEQAQATYQSPATCELYRSSPNHTSVLTYGVDAVSGPKFCSSTVWLPFLEPISEEELTEPVDANRTIDLPRASDGRLCWVDNASYGSAKDGACGEADIISIYTHSETIALGQSQDWWKSPITGRVIQPIPYGSEPYTVLDCHQACIDNPECGGWQFQDRTCILKTALDCTPTITRTASPSTVAGISGCVDVSSDNFAEKTAVDTSDLWFLDCTRPRCTQPYSYGGQWVKDTYVPDLKYQDACWYKQYTPDELFGGCVQDRWIVINGGSNSLSFFIQMVNLFAPLQRMGDSEPLIDFGYDDGVNIYPMVDIVFRRDSLPVLDRNSSGIIHFNRKRFCDVDASLPCYYRSLVLPDDQVDWPPAYAAALERFLSEAPYEAGATRLTLVVGQFWSAAKEALKAVGSVGQNSGWAGKNVLFYGQAMTWYSCNVDGWCDIPALGNTNEEMLSKYQSDVDDVLSVGKEICDSDHIDCFFATAPYGSSPGERGRAMISTLEDKTASYKWAHFIDYNGFLLDEEMVGGHLMPSMFLPAFAMLWNTVCDDPSIGCPQAISSSPNCWTACSDRQEDSSETCPNCFDSWECANQVQCDAQALDPVPWQVATLIASNNRPENESENCPFARNEYIDSCKNRIWCGTVTQGWVVGILVFLAGIVVIGLAQYKSIRDKKKQKEKPRIKNDVAAPPPVIAISRAESPSTTSMSAVSNDGKPASFSAFSSPMERTSSSHWSRPRLQNSSSSLNFVTSVGNDSAVIVFLPPDLDSRESSVNDGMKASSAVASDCLHVRSPVCVDDFIDDHGTASISKDNDTDIPSPLHSGNSCVLKDLSMEAEFDCLQSPVCVDDFIDSISVRDEENPALKADKPEAPPKDYLHSLGIARLLASIHIVLGHLYAKGETANIYFFGWGFTWVPWFFMLSGYVLTHARLNSRDPAKVDGPYNHIAKRLSTIFPMYSFGVLLSMLIVVLSNLKLPGYDVLIAQSYLMQSWVPLWTEHALLSHCWFLSNMVVYWAAFGLVYKSIRKLSLISTCSILSVICVLPWFLVIVPAASNSIEADWYSEHTWGSNDSANDTWTVMLKFCPIFYAHIFVFGMLLSVLRHRVKNIHNTGNMVVGHRRWSRRVEQKLLLVLSTVMRFGAIFGYFGLILVFTVKELQPSAYKLSARLSVLLPLQGLVLLGLSPLPHLIANKRLIDPLAFLFALGPTWIGEVSYCQYILQFIMYNLFPVAFIGNASFFFYLLGASMLSYKFIQEPAANAWKKFLPKNDKGGPVCLLPSFAIGRVLLIPSSVLAVILIIAKSTYVPPRFGTSAVGASSGLNPSNSTNATSLPDVMRVTTEAVDLKLDWTFVDTTEEENNRQLINPSMLFRNDENGNLEWIRAARAHSVEEETNQGSYGDQVVTEQLLRFKSSIALSREPFTGDLSAGFDEQGIQSWGLVGAGPLSIIDSSLISHVGKGSAWNDLCEPKPSFNRESSWLLRKQVSGPEDPKLVQWSDDSWGVTFSSYPPASLLSNESSREECKWTDKAVMQMFLAEEGTALASGDKAHGTRLQCGNPTGMEKNWIAFSHDGSLYYVYSVEPHVIVQVRTKDGKCVEQYKTSSGDMKELAKLVDAIRGSATAIRYSESEYLALLHTTEASTGYSTHAYTFEAKPPFAVRRISKKIPLQGGGRAFPSSLSLIHDKVLIGYGDGDKVARAFVMTRASLEEKFDWCSESV